MVGSKASPASNPGPFRTFCISGMGTALEFYDFVIYGKACRAGCGGGRRGV